MLLFTSSIGLITLLTLNYNNLISSINEGETFYINIDHSNPLYEKAIRESISYWESKDNIIFIETNDPYLADMSVNWIKDFGNENLGQAFNTGYIQIGLGDSLCQEQWEPYSYNSILDIAKHEIGHTLGYEHSFNKEDVMYAYIEPLYKNMNCNNPKGLAPLKSKTSSLKSTSL